jgi:tetratricopeptide (TPR) repeat protein
VTEDPGRQDRPLEGTAHPLAVALGLLRADAPGDILRNPPTWPRWAVLLPHVLAATAFLDQEHAPAAGLLQDASWLLDLAGTYLRARARLNDALPLFERALAITEATYGPDHPNVGATLNNLAGALRALGHPDQAQPLYERALAITEATYGPDHPDVATTLNNLATALSDLSHPDQAQPLLKRALAITEATYGPNHPDVAIRLNNLATALRDLGHPDQAQPLYERAAAIQRTRRSHADRTST